MMNIAFQNSLRVSLNKKFIRQFNPVSIQSLLPGVVQSKYITFFLFDNCKFGKEEKSQSKDS